MAARKIKDACVSAGEYMHNNEKKKRWVNVGSLFEREDGSLALKLEVMPLPKTNKDGQPEIWIAFFDPRERDQQPSRNQAPGPVPRPQFIPQQQQQQQQPAQSQQCLPEMGDPDQIPF